MLKGMSVVQPIRRRLHSGGDAISTPCLPQLAGSIVIAAAIGCTAKHVYDLAKQNQIPHYRIRALVRFDPQAIANWLETCRIAA
jgi:excisionase family DNA binding protein